MYVGTVLTFVGGGIRALSTLPGLNQHMSQVGWTLPVNLEGVKLSLVFPLGCPILLELIGPGTHRDGQPTCSQPPH